MRKYNKEVAISELKNIINLIPDVRASGRRSATHTKWVFSCHNILESIFGPTSKYFGTFTALPWEETGSFIVHGWDPQFAIEAKHNEAFNHCLNMAEGLFESAIDELEKFPIEDLYESSPAEDSETIIRTLNLIERKLRKLIRTEPTNEREVQHHVEDLLIASDIEYSREKESIEYSSKTYVPDFILKNVCVALEIKICNRSNREKEIISEINDDILAYQKRYKNIVFLIYDIGKIRDIDKFKKSFEENENVIIMVVKH